ncbi:MAG: hypothetical protein ABIP97_04935, partial [Chthoniobacterales bacterium]
DQDVAPVASRVAGCVDPCRGEAFRLLEFASSEAILNARQHSGGAGFVSAQYAPKKELARIGVADCGIGIRASFQRNESPFYKKGMTELDALLLALKPEVSSTTHLRTAYGSSPNKGVGLSMMLNLMSQSLGYMCLISGEAWWYKEGQDQAKYGVFRNGKRFEGTICAIAFQRGQIDNYFEMLERARNELKLKSDKPVGNIFI